eukprot:superscaffoldBa00014516_g26371
MQPKSTAGQLNRVSLQRQRRRAERCLLGGGDCGREKSTQKPLQRPGWLVRWMSGWLAVELSPAFPPFPGGAVTRQNVHSPNPEGAAGLRKLLRRDRLTSQCTHTVLLQHTATVLLLYQHRPEPRPLGAGLVPDL